MELTLTETEIKHYLLVLNKASLLMLSDVLMETLRKAVAPPVQPANLLTILKALTNLFDNSCLHQWLRTHSAEVSSQVK
jgi:hypothetical protein